MKKIGLRIDVDTFRGTKHGTVKLCEILAANNIKGSFFFTVGPDNMGKHLWRLLKPGFLWKMLRTNAASLYGPEIILMGTFFPGPNIGKRLSATIKAVAEAGHEVGLHAYDHQKWQAKVDKMSRAQISAEIAKGITALKTIIGENICCSAVPGWKCPEGVVEAKEEYNFDYNSDCRGESIFMPLDAQGNTLTTPQVPVTMPTYDEVLGRDGINDENYNEYMLAQLKDDALNVLTIHAEAEGGKCAGMFADYITKAMEMGFKFVPLGELVKDAMPISNTARIIQKQFPGREGTLGRQCN